MMRALTIALAVAAAPALADLTPSMNGALQVCSADATSLTDRVATLQVAGWRAVPPDQADAAATALAVWPIARMGGMLDRTAAERAAMLMQGAANMRDYIGRDLGSEHWLMTDEGPAWMNIAEFRPNLIKCFVAAPVTADDLSAVLGLPADVQDTDYATVTYFSTSGNRVNSPTLMIYDAGHFGDIPTLPLLAMPPVTGASD